MIIFFHRIKVRLSWPLPPVGGKYPGGLSVKGVEGITGLPAGKSLRWPPWLIDFPSRPLFRFSFLSWVVVSKNNTKM